MIGTAVTVIFGTIPDVVVGLVIFVTTIARVIFVDIVIFAEVVIL